MVCENRAVIDDRREGLALLVYSPALLDVEVPAERVARPVRPRRPRLVLVADGKGEVRWWDPSATRGPLAAEDLPLSPELREELRRLRAAHAELRNKGEAMPRGLDRLDFAWERAALDSQAAAVWRRARSELGRDFAVGFMGIGMARPVWSPSDLEDDDSDYD